MRRSLDGALPAAPRRPVAYAVPNVSEGRDPAHHRRRWWTPAGSRACGCSTSTPTPTTTAASSRSPASRSPLQDALVEPGGGVHRPHRPAPPPRRPPARRGARRGADRGARRRRRAPGRPRSPPGSRSASATELNLPVFLYGAVATDPDRTRPRDFRRDGLEELERAIDEGELVPDARAAPAAPDAPARCWWASRPPLIALNVWLPEGTPHRGPRHRGPRARVRRRPARRARPRASTCPEAGMAQVSMNIEDHRAAPPALAIAAVRDRGRAPRHRGRRGRAGRAHPARGPAGRPEPVGARHPRVPPGPDARARPAPGAALMAKRKKRKSAGPPPVTGPKRPAAAAAAAEARGQAGDDQAPSGRAGRRRRSGACCCAPGIVAAALLPLPDLRRGRGRRGRPLLVSAFAFALMLPLGILLDRFRYRRQMRRWEAQAGRTHSREGERGRPPARRLRGARATCCPPRAPLRQRVIDVARDAFERYGYARIVDADLRGDRGLRARRGHEHRRRAQGDVHLPRPVGGAHLTLRPEGTAPVVRAFVQHGMHKLPLPVKLWYVAPDVPLRGAPGGALPRALAGGRRGHRQRRPAARRRGHRAARRHLPHAWACRA